MHDDVTLMELTKIDSLLRSKDFSFEMAKSLNGAYSGDKEKFISASDEVAIIDKTLREEKIAKNLSGFYAVECGVGLLWEQTQTTPVEWLGRILNNTAGDEAMFLLSRFANATWKAGQPFISMECITQFGFAGAGLLSGEEIESHLAQVRSAASILLEHMKVVEKSEVADQMQRLRELLQDLTFAETIAAANHAYHYTSHTQPVPVFLSADDAAAKVHRTVKDEKIAMNLAGFYALEAGINYLVSTKRLVPSVILESIEDDSISETDKILFLRFANATWKAGQPFRDLNRIMREVFTPVYFLDEDEIEKDIVQVKVAAKKLLAELKHAG